MEKMFENAVPVWLKGREREMHCRVLFEAEFKYTEGSEAEIAIASSGIYNLFINGKFTAYGPARAGRNHFKVDRINIKDNCVIGENTVILEVCGYYAASFYIQKQPSFVMAEVNIGGNAAAWTGLHFTARQHPYYIQKSQRYSYQRPMLEGYRITEAVSPSDTEEICTVNTEINLLKRDVPYPEYEKLSACYFSRGTAKTAENTEIPYDRAIKDVGENLSGFPIEELENLPYRDCKRLIYRKTNAAEGTISAGEYQIYRFPYCATGNLRFTLSCKKDAVLYVLFDEILKDGTVDFFRGGCTNAVKYELKAGGYDLRFFEVYTMQYVQFVLLTGECTVENVELTEYKHPSVGYDTGIFSPKIKKIADAAIETFRQNSVDLFTDCPSRERAGWLCDSFFSGRTEYMLTGGSQVEKAFLENFLNEKTYEGLPDGMLPMCYPSDCLGGTFIPQWALWLIVELEEYGKRSGDADLVCRFEDKIVKLFDYFEAFENEDGLLENLSGWNFVEWSKANELIKDVNYPTNMLYAAALSAAARLYGAEAWEEKSEKVKAAVLVQSYNGTFFCDNAVRKNGKLTLTGECTEVCQYYAFFFGIADKNTHPELFEFLKDKNQIAARLYPANAFIGYYLRLEIYVNYGELEIVRNDILSFFGKMAEKTGTLWEHNSPYASCDHGFAAYVICWLDKLKKDNFI